MNQIKHIRHLLAQESLTHAVDELKTLELTPEHAQQLKKLSARCDSIIQHSRDNTALLGNMHMEKADLKLAILALLDDFVARKAKIHDVLRGFKQPKRNPLPPIPKRVLGKIFKSIPPSLD